MTLQHVSLPVAPRRRGVRAPPAGERPLARVRADVVLQVVPLHDFGAMGALLHGARPVRVPRVHLDRAAAAVDAHQGLAHYGVDFLHSKTFLFKKTFFIKVLNKGRNMRDK